MQDGTQEQNTSPKERVNYWYVLIALLIISAIAAFIWFSPSLPFNKRAIYKIYTEESVSGLLVDAPVELKGVDVGVVKSITLKNNQFVEIELRLQAGIPITNGTVATLTTQGLSSRGFTGYVFVSLTDSGKDSSPLVAPPNEPYPVIPVTPSRVLSVDTTMEQITASLQEVTTLLRTLLDKENIDSLKELIR